MTATAAAYCASNPIVYVQVVTRKSAVAAPIFRLTALTSSPSPPPPPPSNIPSVETAPLKGKQRSDNHEALRRPTPAIVLQRLPTTTDQRDPSFNETEIEQILTGVGLRRRTTQRVVPPTQSLRPLTKPLAVPVCLLPLKTNTERIRHALSIVLPYLKFLSITHDLESFCFTDASIFVETLPSRSGPQVRSMLTTTTKTTTTTIKRKTKRHLTSKAGKLMQRIEMHMFDVRCESYRAEQHSIGEKEKWCPSCLTESIRHHHRQRAICVNFASSAAFT